MYYRLKGLVLRSKVSSEADKILTLYTLEWGKISAIVPGAKKIKAKFGSASEPVIENEIMVYLNNPSARPKVTSSRIINCFPVLRTDWRRFSLAQHCAEITEMLTPYNSENYRKYELLQRTWQLIETAKNPWRIFTAYTLRFLKISGYGFLDFMRTGSYSETKKREMETIRLFSTLSGEEIDGSLEVDPEVEKNILKKIEYFMNNYLPCPLHTKRFWQKIDSCDRKPVLTIK